MIVILDKKNKKVLEGELGTYQTGWTDGNLPVWTSGMRCESPGDIGAICSYGYIKREMKEKTFVPIKISRDCRLKFFIFIFGW